MKATEIEGHCTREVVSEAGIYRDGDHDCLIWAVKFVGGNGFGFTILNPGHPSVKDLIVSLTDTFGIKYDDITAIESIKTGKRFTLAGWRNRNWPEKYLDTVTEFDRKVAYYEHRIEQAENDIYRSKEDIAKLPEKYIDWEVK